MAILGGRWRSLAHRHEAAVAEARAGQDEERAAAFERIKGLAEQWPEWTPRPEAVTQ
jgi:hypothetical protein